MTASRRPVIGLTAGNGRSAKPYAEAIMRAGGTPLLVLPTRGRSAEETLNRVHGLLVPGGPNIDPSWLGGRVGAGTARDTTELPLLAAAIGRDLPVLGICRGMQAINVVLGGGLVPELHSHKEPVRGGEESAYHRIFISVGSKLARTLGSGGIVRVNSRHQQGVNEATKARSLLASAYSLDDGIIEALESPDHSWVVGVQFHPELRRQMPPHFERLFSALIERAAVIQAVAGV